MCHPHKIAESLKGLKNLEVRDLQKHSLAYFLFHTSIDDFTLKHVNLICCILFLSKDSSGMSPSMRHGALLEAQLVGLTLHIGVLKACYLQQAAKSQKQGSNQCKPVLDYLQVDF